MASTTASMVTSSSTSNTSTFIHINGSPSTVAINNQQNKKSLSSQNSVSVTQSATNSATVMTQKPSSSSIVIPTATTNNFVLTFSSGVQMMKLQNSNQQHQTNSKLRFLAGLTLTPASNMSNNKTNGNITLNSNVDGQNETYGLDIPVQVVDGKMYENGTKNNASKDDLNHSTKKQEPPLIILDENSQTSIKSLNSTSSSSSSNENSPKKKRRRGENERLMEDLHKIDQKLAANVTKMLRKNQRHQNMNSDNNNNINENNIKVEISNDNGNGNYTGDNNKAKSLNSTNDDCPAAHLRPRRNIRPPNFSGYFSGYTNSNSCSPTFLSPIKSTNSKLNNNNNNFASPTKLLLQDASKQLSKLTVVQDIKQEDIDSCNKINEDTKVSLNDALFQKEKTLKMMQRLVKTDFDVSVFATLITPKNLMLKPDRYMFNYVSLRIIDVRPIRYVELINSNQSFKCPVMELKAVDIDDRFKISYARHVWDDSNVSLPSNEIITIYLLGSYALKSKELAQNGQIINILKFRTIINPNKDLAATSYNSNMKRSYSKKRRITEVDEQPLAIIVDSWNDLKCNFIFKNEQKIEETEKNDATSVESTNKFIEIYNSNPTIETSTQIKVESNSDTNICELTDMEWSPLISYSKRWLAPDDPKELNRSLYVMQPCIAKFESSSRTVKMSSIENNLNGNNMTAMVTPSTSITAL